MKVYNEKFVSWAEAKKILDKKAKEKELGYEQKNALEHLQKFSKTAQAKIKGIFEELESIERLNEKQKIAIANMLPEDEDDIRILFSNEALTLSEEDKKKILSIVKKFS